jgi:hypothetical protein
MRCVRPYFDDGMVGLGFFFESLGELIKGGE